MLMEDLIVNQAERKRFVRTEQGKMYRLGKKLGQGGVGRAFIVYDEQDHDKKYVLKEYPVPENTDMILQQRNIRRNLESLIQNPVKDENGQPQHSMVPPIEMVSFPKSKTFGYVMEYVPIVESNYLTLKRLRDSNPGADILCRIGKEMGVFFSRLERSAGVCYKDINEGNIYLNPATGDVKIIDNDNVGDPSTRTISGTSFYMAPEVVTGHADPDRHTDRFQLAAYLYRLFIGGAPYEGVQAVRYMIDNNQTMEQAAPEVFGRNAVFVFDPNNRSNSIRVTKISSQASEEEKKTLSIWKAQTVFWDRLPAELKKNFIQTFTTADRENRVSPTEWRNTFEWLEQTLITCPNCKKITFGVSGECFYCGSNKRRTIRCKQCGQATPSELKVCICCKKDPRTKPEDQEPCPHCGKNNAKTAERCSTCGKYIKVTCAKCKTVSSGDKKTCPKCKSALYSPCPACGKDNLVNASTCVHCGGKMTAGNATCSQCGRVNPASRSQCIECGAPLRTFVPPTFGPPDSTKSFKFHMRIGGQTYVYILKHTFGRAPVLYYADQLYRDLPHVPLFEIKRNAQNDTYAVKNKTGMEMQRKTLSTGDVTMIPPEGIASLAPDHRLTFGNCVYQGETLKILLKSIS